MKTLMLSTALVTASAFGAMAQSSAGTTPSGDQAMVPAFLSSEFTGMSLYTLDSDDARMLRDNAGSDMSMADRNRMRWTSSDTFVSQRDSWEDVGNIDDIVMTQDGEFRGILIDVGGFLGIGARTVLVDFEDIYFVSDDADAMAMDGADTTAAAPADGEAQELSDFFVVIAMSEDELESLPEWDETQLEAGFEMRNYGSGGGMTGADTESTGNMTSGSEVDETAVETDTAATGTDATGTQTETAGTETEVVETETASGSQGEAVVVFSTDYQMLEGQDRTVDRLIGANVYDANGENIGEVNDVMLDADNQATGVIVDVGGFLGMGEHTVNLPLDQAQIGWNQNDDDVRVQVQMTGEELEAMPEFEG